jgi:tetratricopeptide (TPR) repeat protein
MKSSDRLLLGVILTAILLSGCTTLDRFSSKQSQVVSEKPIEAEQQVPELSPFEQLIVDIKAKPDQYMLAQPAATASMRHEYNLALQAKREGEYARAIPLFEQMTVLYPQLSGPWVQLGDIALSVEKDQKQALTNAYTHFFKATQVNPHNYRARNRLAKVLRQQGRFKEAEAEYKKALESWPSFANGYKNLGILYDLYIGNKQAALDNYQVYQALQEKPERKVRGWIADLTRQIDHQQNEQLAEANQ